MLMLSCFYCEVTMSRRPSSRYSEMPMRVTDGRMSMANATPQRYTYSRVGLFATLNCMSVLYESLVCDTVVLF